MKNLYLKIIDLLKNSEQLKKRGFKPIRHIDLYDSQPDDPEAFEFTTPAVFIDYSTDWNAGTTLSVGTLTVELHILTDRERESECFSLHTPPGLQRLEYYQLIADLLEGCRTETTSYLHLIREEPVTTDDGVYHKLTFTANVMRKRASDKTGTIDNVHINKQFTVDL